MPFFLKVFISAVLIALTTTLAKSKPALSGLLISVPLTSLIAIPLAYFESKNIETASAFANGILVGVPVSLLFFVPFVLFNRGFLTGISFWGLYAMGFSFLTIGIFISQRLLK